jgi:sulfite reductase (NADPH) flavoprotein alpha-component
LILCAICSSLSSNRDAFLYSSLWPKIALQVYRWPNITAQSLVQQVAYSLADKIFTYSPESFDLDLAVLEWAASGEKNAHGYSAGIHPMQIRQGAGNLALGYMFSKDYDLRKRHIPHVLLACTSGLRYLRPALEQLSLLYNVANPFVAHIAAADYAISANGALVSDYSKVMSTADDLGFALICSPSAYESQHMALLATVMAHVMPTFHVYDGVKVGRETTRVVDILDQTGLNNSYQSVIKALSENVPKRFDDRQKAIKALEVFNSELGGDYGFFEYAGHASPDVVLVTFGSVESSLASQLALLLSKRDVRVGAINVRIYRPFIEEEFLRVLPSSTKAVAVLGQVSRRSDLSDPTVHSSLYEDVLPILTMNKSRIQLHEAKYSRFQTWSPDSMVANFQTILDKAGFPIIVNEDIESLDLIDSTVQQYSFWQLDDSPLADAAIVLAQALSRESSHNVTISKAHDNEMQGGSTRTDVRKSPKSLETNFSVENAGTVVVDNVDLLGKINVLRSVKSHGNLILKLPGVKDEDVATKLPTAFKKELAQRDIKLYLIDPSASALEGKDQMEALIVETAFLRVALPESEPTGLNKLAAVLGTHDLVRVTSEDLEKTLREIEVPKSWVDTGIGEEGDLLPRDLCLNGFVPFDKGSSEPVSQLQTWQKAAKGFLFKEAYGVKPALRPDLPTKTYTVRVKENRRLTPLSYDRNIFHVEFDIGSSGLKYEIGEALGIHAENDKGEVMEFIKFYGLDPDQIVEVANRDDASVMENRTIYQSLVQNIDIFGRPPKRFYEALAEFADNEEEQKELRVLGGPEGAKEFQRRAEVDTITYADILLEFTSARPSFHDIVRLVSPMKRREYSIASCQAYTPTSIALMVVVVNWVDPTGRDRFGQATRYLSQLKLGSPITVSIKPSVMKLPPKSTQPLIMAGLGTGLAPFRAFVQHRALEKSQGKAIGSVLLYMGSRHQREEYCYGEEWEAYQAAGVITLLGRAFSRDQPQKIYIQDRMRQTMDDIVQAYIKEEGVFYLCGPTWPVPDVTTVLQEAIAMDAAAMKKASSAAGAGGKKTDPRKEIERLKDEGRYVLEVY